MEKRDFKRRTFDRITWFLPQKKKNEIRNRISFKDSSFSNKDAPKYIVNFLESIYRHFRDEYNQDNWESTPYFKVFFEKDASEP